MPDFDPRTFGASKLNDIIKRFSTIYEMKKYPGKGNTNIVAYKPRIRKNK